MNIVLTDCETISDNYSDFDCFKQFGNVVLYDTSDPQEACQRLSDADMVICNKTIISEKTMISAPKLKYIGLFATGYNNIDIESAKRRGITVCNAGSYSTDAVAQHTFALILEHFSKVREYSGFVDEGGWKNCRVFSPVIFETHELSRKTFGIVGYGNIGRAAARIALAFNMRVLVYTRTPKKDSSVKFVSFEELISESDIVSVHCPLNSQSENLFNRESFAKFKNGAFFVNTARGGIVNEHDLKEALENGILSGAAVDTLTVEPMSKDCILYGAKNLIITPHIAWAPKETVRRLIDTVIYNIKNYLEANPTNRVV